MSNSKISALTSASTPLAGTEVLPIVQGGTTKQVSVANLTTGRAVSASSMTLTTALAATSGGTGSTSAFVANAIPYASSTTALSTSSNLTYNGTNLVLANGAIAIGSAAANVSLRINKNVTGATFSYATYIDGQIQSDVTSEYASIQSTPTTQAAAFTLNRLRHFYANPGAFGAGSVVNNQYGFAVENSLTGATNNFGFHSNIANATGCWNFYANGTAPNYFAGNLGIGTTSTTPYTVRVSKGITGSTFAGGVISDAAILSDVTARADMFLSIPQTQAAAFTLARAIAYKAQLGTIGLGSAITNAAAFEVDANWTGATNNYGFYGNIASAANRYNVYMAGTAPNWFSGDVLVFGAGGLGYTTGSGGTVTQGTSRTTGVTLNKTNGAITLFSAAGSTTFQSFTVTNSTVAATDVIHVVQKSGTDKYAIWVTAVAAGSFQITFATLSGTTTEQPVFNFAVLKAVTA